MKTKNSDITVKIFLVVVSVILVGLIIAWSTGVFKDKRNDLNKGTEKIDTVLASVADFDMLYYEGKTIRGETLEELISEIQEKDLEVGIGVRTLASGSGTYKFYNYSMVIGSDGDKSENKLGSEEEATTSTDVTKPDYINPSGKFKGELVKDNNDNIIGLVFIQHK
jgi:hypothetical protein